MRRNGSMGVIGMLVSAAALLASGGAALAHGGAPIEEDRCVFQVGSQRIHFSAYQPDRSEDRHKEWCRYLPATAGRTFLVFDLVDDGLRDERVMAAVVPAGYRPSADDADLIHHAVVYRTFESVPTGTMNLEHDFAGERGRFRAVLMGGDRDVELGGLSFTIGEREPRDGSYLPTLVLGVGGVALMALFWLRQRDHDARSG